MGVKDEDKGLHAHWHDHVSGMETHSHAELVRLTSRLRRIEEAAREVMNTCSDPDTFDDDEMDQAWDALKAALNEEE